MRYLLDTNVCIQILNENSIALKKALQAHSPRDIVLCSIVKAELYFGAYKSTKIHANIQLLNQLFAIFESVPFTDTAAEIAGNIRSHLNKAGTPIGPYDLQIAATALAHNLVVVTHNVREFSRIGGLRIEDWEVL